MKIALLSLLSFFALATHLRAEDKPQKDTPSMSNKPAIQLTEAEWKKRLTSDQYAVTRQAATERPFGEIYHEFERQGAGTYYCICCGGELFNSDTKFHSGCGWPSFYDQSKANNVLERRDQDGMRVEVLCRRCGAHLGHVFDGESVSAKTPTNRRFCINGIALTYVEKGGKAPPLLEVTSLAVEKKKDEVAKEAGIEPKKP